MWRDLNDPNTRVVQIHVQKIRFREIGQVGMAELAYNHVTATYHELNRANVEIPPKYAA